MVPSTIMRFASPIILTAGLLILGAGCSSKTTRVPEQNAQANGGVVQQPANTQPSVTIATPDAMPVFTPEEVSTHATQKDCWIIIQDKVYNVTSFIPKYPDKKIIADQCGKDATTIYQKLSEKPDVKTAEAQKLLPQYEIGLFSK